MRMLAQLVLKMDDLAITEELQTTHCECASEHPIGVSEL